MPDMMMFAVAGVLVLALLAGGAMMFRQSTTAEAAQRKRLADSKARYAGARAGGGESQPAPGLKQKRRARSFGNR